MHPSTRTLIAAIALGALLLSPTARAEYEVRVTGSVDDSVSFWKAQDFWGEERRDVQLRVPRAFTVAINKSWRAETAALPVELKKELFYRALLPLILKTNEGLAADRTRLLALTARLGAGEPLGADDRTWLRELAIYYGLFDPNKSSAAFVAGDEQLRALATRVDEIPPALALGQGAYESGYGTSRFALEGNSLFGMWTWGGEGLRPKQQRSGKGDYKVASYLWPFDSVLAYVHNLNTQGAYAELREKRAALRNQGVEPTGLDLVDTLTRYSERGTAYVDTLRGIIRHNGLDIADSATLRDGTPILLVQAEDGADKEALEAELVRLRASGDLERIVAGMRLDLEGRSAVLPHDSR